MVESDLSDWKTSVKCEDGNLYSTAIPAVELANQLELYLRDELDDVGRSVIECRGPLYAEGWQRNVWYIPLARIVTVTSRP